jgi:DNA-binding Lrp family transcriptional regulator
LRRIGAITGFSATLDPTVLGYGICALVFLKITQHGWRAARDAIVEVPGVESLMMCAGEYDLIATVRSPDMAHFRDTLLSQLHAIDDVLGSSTAFVLDEVRRPIAP